ncbi:MAG TPA: hemerythrin domain-containing protein [Methylibium sp.]|nr:hemerythrin domain-containing protein [Methylibium sp.]
MTTLIPSDTEQGVPTLQGFDVLDVCHRHTLVALGRLAALTSALRRGEVDADARALAREVHAHFEGNAHLHHEDEERHVFPALLDRGDASTVQAVLRLRQDHRWLEQNWREIGPQLDAIASGQSWVDLDALHEAVQVFTALSHDHIALEEAFIYPQLRTRLPERAQRDMAREMAQRRASPQVEPL